MFTILYSMIKIADVCNAIKTFVYWKECGMLPLFSDFAKPYPLTLYE